jgi:hypothetical protein
MILTPGPMRPITPATMEDQDFTSVCRVSLLISALVLATAVMAGTGGIAGIDDMTSEGI